MRVRPISYEILITPLIAKNTYGNQIDITKDINVNDFVKDNGIGTIKKEIDNGDFDFGVFVFDSINITCINTAGMFSDSSDYRSIFKYSRDKAKVTVNYYNGISNTPTISFKGIVDDRASKIDFVKDEIKIVVLSQDSIINRVKVSAGSITNGSMISTAIKNILNVPAITSILNYSPTNINVLNDYVIDDVTKLENKTAKQALDLLLAASNSVLLIDKNDNIVVKSRDFVTGKIYNFYGENDLLGRQNIVSIKNYNSGLQRAFSTVEVNNQVRSNLGFIDLYGDNKKSLEFDFITNPVTAAEIAANLLDYWKSPKTELEITAKTSEVMGLEFFDLVSVDYYYRLVPANNSKLPIYGVSKYGTAKYPFIYGNMKIRADKAFKVIGIEHDTRTFLTKIKLRENGKDLDDGYFSLLGTFYGSALYGFNVYQLDANRINPNIRSVYGAAKLGTVHYGNI